MSDDNPYVIPEMDPTLRKQIQQCNWQVVNVTTPANYFHVLRRQVKYRHSFFLLPSCMTIFKCMKVCLLFLDSPGLQKAFDCYVSKESPSTQGLQIESF